MSKEYPKECIFCKAKIRMSDKKIGFCRHSCRLGSLSEEYRTWQIKITVNHVENGLKALIHVHNADE